MLPEQDRERLQQEALELQKKHKAQGIAGTVRLPEDKILPPGVRIVGGQTVSMPVEKQ
jgi:hypothetical protein